RSFAELFNLLFGPFPIGRLKNGDAKRLPLGGHRSEGARKALRNRIIGLLANQGFFFGGPVTRRGDERKYTQFSAALLDLPSAAIDFVSDLFIGAGPEQFVLASGPRSVHEMRNSQGLTPLGYRDRRSFQLGRERIVCLGAQNGILFGGPRARFSSL